MRRWALPLLLGLILAVVGYNVDDGANSRAC